MEQAYQTILKKCIQYADRWGWETTQEGAHLGYYKWGQQKWWHQMENFIVHMDLSEYPILSWNWVDQCDIGIDYFNQYLLKHKNPYPIFKHYVLQRIYAERIGFVGEFPLICMKPAAQLVD